MRKFISFLIVFLLFSGSMFAQWQKVTLRLQEKLDETTRDQYVRTLVVFQDQVDVAAMDEQFYAENASIERRTYEVITTLQAKATQSQRELINYLAVKESSDDVFRYDPFWIVNMVMVEAKPEVIYEIAERADVNFVDLDARLDFDRPVGDPVPANENIESVEPGVKIINAHKLWELGITGEGRLIMGIDTGVDVNHPALSYKWRGNSVPADQAWFDPSSGTTSPNDCDGHGTHTMGTMTGWVDGDTVGVAIGAEWIASNSLCGGGSHTSRTVASFEWAMDPDNNPSTIDDMPDAITNSWYDPSISDDCNSIYKTTLDAVEAVGIAPIFSAGNSGPGTSTITSPKNINTNTVNIWSTAALDGAQILAGSTNPVASFSSRGPSDCGGTGSLLIKPEAGAPGVNVRSSYAGGGYTQLSGTSMAAPHVAGAVTLLRQFAPQLTGKQIKEALYATAKDLGDPGEDNTYGMGLIDVYQAFLSLGTPDETPPEPVVDLATSEPTSSSLTLSWTVPYDSSQNGVTGYDIRMSTTMITDTNDFYAATPVEFVGQPKPFGELESVQVDGLEFSTTYYFAVICTDIWDNKSDLSNVAMGTTYDAPEIAVTPAEIAVELDPGQSTTENLNIANVSATNSTLDFEISMANNTFPEDMVQVKLVPKNSAIEAEQQLKDNPMEKGGIALEGFGGPDMFGYEWIDSDEPDGPDYVWNDISGTGTAVSNWIATGTFSALDEGYAGPFDLGFNFKFYGEEYSSIYFGSNGFVTFLPFSGNSYTNDQIPDNGDPNAIIASVWDDLDGGNGGNVYYQSFADKFVVQYDNWGEYFGSGTFTFQVVLYTSGKIMIYYNSMTGDLGSSTVGIENAAGDDGLQVAYNSSYIANEKAVMFASEPDWLALSNNGGMLYNGNNVDIELTFSTEDYPQGNYSMDVIVSSSDPMNSEIVVPVSMVLGEGSGIGNWASAINVMDAGGTETAMDLTIGMDGLGTDGIDDDLGEYELPPVPPAGVFDARLILPSNVPSPVDIRGLNNEEAEWVVKFQPSTAGYPFALSWDNTDFPDGSFMMVDPFGGSIVNVNMKEESSVEITNSSINELHIMYSQMMSMTMMVDEGWNILSMPVHADDMMVSSVFPDAASPAYAFDGGYVTADEFMMGEGYWLKFDEAGSHEMTGQAVSMAVGVDQGWNIVGPFDQPVTTSEITSNPTGILASVFYGFDNGYSVAEELTPGKGYWVKTSGAGDLMYNMVAKKGDETETEEIAEDALYTIGLSTSDGAAGSYGLMLGIDPAATEGIDSDLGETELPPLPPAGVYDARMILPDGTTGSPADYRTGDNNYTGQVTYTLKYQLGDGGTSMTLDVDIPEIPGTVTMTVQDPFGGVLVNEVVNEGGGQVVVTNTSLTELKLIVDYNAPIPVELSSFAANVVGETIQLVWETATETNNKGFEIERSEDNATFTKVGYMDGNGTTSEKQAYNFTDHHAVSGTYYYRLRQVDFDGTSSYSDAVEVDFVPTEYSLGQNYPNPFNPSTRIKFAVPVDSKVTVTLYNMLGQKVQDIVSQNYSVGLHEVDFNASELSSGMYIYSITALGVDGSNFVDTKKMMLMK
ncbi:MAG: hypothetical protein SCALA702_35990 [Melioribacteraceae bacterium]|nr:MAG: hypothetical protein SCALA702_35990 [Melioribacteraceae bacterium]